MVMRRALWLSAVCVCLLSPAWLLAQPPSASTADFRQPPGPPQPPLPPSPAVPLASPPGGMDEGPVTGPAEAVPDDEYHGPHLTLSADYLYWWITRAPSGGALVTASRNPGDRGILGTPTTGVLFGDDRTNFDALNGVRFNALAQINGCWGVSVTGFWLEQKDLPFLFGSSGVATSPTIARPYQDATTKASSSLVVAGPGMQGGVHDDVSSELWGLDANAVYTLVEQDQFRIGLLGGVRYFDLDENLTLTSNSVSLSSGFFFNNVAVPPNSSVLRRDLFYTRNHFYGGQIGTEIEGQLGPFILGMVTKLALGATQEFLDTSGASTLYLPGAIRPSAQAVGGVYVQGTNLVSQVRTRFAVVPEINLCVGAHVSDHVFVFAGYNLIYMSETLRASDQVDRNINSSLLAAPNFVTRLGPAYPVPQFHTTTDFFAHGANVGIGIRF
jgi:hypothetical protein